MKANSRGAVDPTISSVSLRAASSWISRTRGNTSGNLVPVATGPWSDDEINTTVDIYFQMLTLELAEEPYVKAEYQRDIARIVDRSIGSIGKKLSNISAAVSYTHLTLPTKRIV